MMTTSFSKEWSDDDSSHSSEEFLFVKGGVAGSTAKPDEGDSLFVINYIENLERLFHRGSKGGRRKAGKPKTNEREMFGKYRSD